MASGLTSPVDIQHAGDARLFIVEQPGRIRIIDDEGNLINTPFLDIEERVDDSANEMGLLGMAFHPGLCNQRVLLCELYVDLATSHAYFSLPGDC